MATTCAVLQSIFRGDMQTQQSRNTLPNKYKKLVKSINWKKVYTPSNTTCIEHNSEFYGVGVAISTSSLDTTSNQTIPGGGASYGITSGGAQHEFIL